MRIVQIRRVAGVWEGEFEPAVSIDVEGDPEAARRLAQSLMQRYAQESVLEFEPDSDGPDALYLFGGITDRRRVAGVMQEHGFQGGRFDEDRLEIADPGLENFDAAVELARELGVAFGLRRGSVNFGG